MTEDITTPLNLSDLTSLDLDVDIINGHQHLFDLQTVCSPWLTDQPVPHFLPGNYDAADYRADAGPLRVVKTVHVEAESNREDPAAETRGLSASMLDTGKRRHGHSPSFTQWGVALRTRIIGSGE